jgi:hypothetical protein
MLLGFSRFAMAWPSINLGANACKVGTSFLGRYRILDSIIAVWFLSPARRRS